MSGARDVVAALGGRWHGAYGTAQCPAHDDRSPSLSLRDGTAGRILLRCYAGCSGGEVIAALRACGLWSARGETTRARVRPTAVVRHDDRGADQARVDAAQRVWHAARSAANSPVDTYLRHARGVLTDVVPIDIGFVPDLRHPTGIKAPAMVCGVRSPDGTIRGVHRTWLRRDGSGKADLQPQKAMLGRCAGGAVRLSSSWAGELQITEGVETGLAVQSATGRPTWVALSTSGLRTLALPAGVRRITICADGDDAGSAAAQVAAQRWIDEGRNVHIALAPPGLDFADLALATGAGAKVAKVAKVASSGRAA